MILLDWYAQFLAIRHQALIDKREQAQIEFERSIERHESDIVCDSCETLKMQLSIANDEKKILLDRLLNYNQKDETEAPPSEFKPVLTGTHRSYNVRRQMLEREDRIKARLIKQHEVEALEKEILDGVGNVAQS